ncbi:MAG: outer membrane beta-barrel protein [Deltaproteobacteria bacterium]|nr:outer membrane beta-barrel protein [Deltaproteobacteria bacterium]
MRPLSVSKRAAILVSGCALVVCPCVAEAQPLDEAPQRSATGETSANAQANPSANAPDVPAPSPPARAGSRAEITLNGWVEAFWQYNFNEPYNGFTAYRGFDTRHNTFTIQNIVLDTQWRYERVSGRIALQVGHQPDTYYAAEPTLSPGLGLPATGPNVWKFLREAYVSYLAPFAGGTRFEAGLFLSPVGPEGLTVKDEYNWSRSNLAFGAPFYHAGARATFRLSSVMNATVGVFNGWNNVVDNNLDKSVCAQWTYTRPDRLTASVLYFGGVERSAGATGGRGWRHLFDAYAIWQAAPWLSLTGQTLAGFETITDDTRRTDTYQGVQWWAAASVAARVRTVSWLYLAARANFFLESFEAVSNSSGILPDAIFFPTNRLLGLTATADFRPHEHISLRLEYRHDNAAQAIFFDRDNTARPGVPAAQRGLTPTQNTLTVGVTAWF